MIFHQCKHLAPISMKRQKANPELKGKYFCLYKMRITRADFENNYHLIVCDYAPMGFNKCPDRTK